MITLHHLNNSRSQRILWLLEELELPYEIAIYQRDAETRLAPEALSAPEFADYLHWLHYAEGSAVTPMLFEFYLGLLAGATDALSATMSAQIVQQLTYIKGALKQRSFFVGSHFTAADIQMTFVLEVARARGRLSGYPRSDARYGAASVSPKSAANMSHPATHNAAMIGPITKPDRPNAVMPPSVDSRIR